MRVPVNTHYLQLHLAVLLFSLCALFAYWVNASPVFIVFGRTFFAALAIALYVVFTSNTGLALPAYHKRQLILSSLLLVCHWLTFFFSAQHASVSIALITFASYPLWVLLIGYFQGDALKPLAMLGQTILIIIGVALVSGVHAEMGVQGEVEGLVAGLISAFIFAWLTYLNQSLMQTCCSLNLTFWQNLLASLLLLPLVFLVPFSGDIADIGKLLLLGVLFTAFAHNLLLNSMRSIPAFLVSITVCLEPAYGIVAAAVLFAEPLTVTVIVGIALVLISNIWAVMAQRRSLRKG
ncbi:DMT family transporter [Thalassotalea litorea]|uniref:DMT family transporter n=1 Tax=Thalassotalea litorea TaxID=2020715 RepID=A0A5R9IPQ7_9GAMM|nr:DMT family transporter [Thalassotalea litorea]TLU65251.1 DMT family transporter [Thalassotalea litorea]